MCTKMQGYLQTHPILAGHTREFHPWHNGSVVPCQVLKRPDISKFHLISSTFLSSFRCCFLPIFLRKLVAQIDFHRGWFICAQKPNGKAIKFLCVCSVDLKVISSVFTSKWTLLVNFRSFSISKVVYLFLLGCVTRNLNVANFLLWWQKNISKSQKCIT